MNSSEKLLREITEYANQDLKRDIEKHKNADLVYIRRMDDVSGFYLDVNDTGYTYSDQKERNNDFYILVLLEGFKNLTHNGF